jgi:hypothetical protein
MRDPKRIDDFCKTLATIWKTQCPDWRFGQLISNVYGAARRDPFFYEEDETLKLFEDYFNITHYEGTNT